MRDLPKGMVAQVSKRVVYIAAPLSAPTLEGIEENRRRAARWVAWAALLGVAPSATWIVLTGELDESHRELGLAVDCALVERSDRVWLVAGRISSGMEMEAGHARRHGIRVADLTYLGQEPPAVAPSLPPEEYRAPCAIDGCDGIRWAGAMGWNEMLCPICSLEIQTYEEFQVETGRLP